MIKDTVYKNIKFTHESSRDPGAGSESEYFNLMSITSFNTWDDSFDTINPKNIRMVKDKYKKQGLVD